MSREIYVARSAGFTDQSEAEQNWIVRHIKAHTRGALVPTFTVGFSDSFHDHERIDRSAAMIADFEEPDEKLREYIRFAHHLGRPALAFIRSDMKPQKILGEDLLPAVPPGEPGIKNYIASEWLSAKPDNHPSISTYAGKERFMKLQIWIQAHELGSFAVPAMVEPPR